MREQAVRESGWELGQRDGRLCKNSSVVPGLTRDLDSAQIVSKNTEGLLENCAELLLNIENSAADPQSSAVHDVHFLGKHRSIHCTPSCGKFPPTLPVRPVPLPPVKAPVTRTDLKQTDPQSGIQAILRHFPRSRAPPHNANALRGPRGEPGTT